MVLELEVVRRAAGSAEAEVHAVALGAGAEQVELGEVDRDRLEQRVDLHSERQVQGLPGRRQPAAACQVDRQTAQQVSGITGGDFWPTMWRPISHFLTRRPRSKS